jgi:hypothetical protein
MGMLLKRQGKLTDAEPLLVEALEHRRKTLPTGHAYIATSLEQLALLRQEQGRLDEAEQLFREELQIRRTRDGASGVATTQTAAMLAEVLDARGRNQDARAIREEYALPPSSSSPTAP